MKIDIVLDEHTSIRIVRDSHEVIDIADLSFYIPKAIYDNHALSCILRQEDEDIIVPLQKIKEYNENYFIYTCNLLPIYINGEYKLYLNGVNVLEHTFFITNKPLIITLKDNNYQILFQTYANASLKAEIATCITRIQKMTELNINVYEMIQKERGNT